MEIYSNAEDAIFFTLVRLVKNKGQGRGGGGVEEENGLGSQIVLCL